MRIPWAPREGMGPGSWEGQRSSCGCKGSFYSRHKPAWWWKPVLKRTGWQTDQRAIDTEVKEIRRMED